MSDRQKLTQVIDDLEKAAYQRGYNDGREQRAENPQGNARHCIFVATRNAKWFHSFNANGELVWQGYIRYLAAHHCLVQLFDWVSGEPSRKVRVPYEDMSSWKFYKTSEQWREAYYND
jgi:hypothetical protein